MMVQHAEIQDFVGRIVDRFNPQQVILFGSYADGTAGADSDVDLLVVMPDDGNPLAKAAEICRQIDNPFPVDIIVRDPGALRWRISQDDWFLREITEKGLVLYDAAHG